MIHGNDPAEYRRFFQEAWRKYREGSILEPMEDLVAQVVASHPEYHALLESPEGAAKDFTPESGQGNPFLHMGLHVAIREQLAADRPPGIRHTYQRLMHGQPDPHDVEHRLSECLAETLWEAQRADREPDQAVYLDRLRRL
jgi:hypothetical protein